ncbi:hypothetical protein GVAV_000240 [Gurleya vavrai]
MILVFLAGTFIGLLSAPFFEFILIYIITRRRTKPQAVPVEYAPTPSQYSLLFESTKLCTDLSWFNICLQRYFLELSQSFAYKEKLKRMMLKKIKKFEKFVNVDIENIDVGREFPVFSSVRVLSDSMIKELIKDRKNRFNDTETDETDESLIEEMKKEIEKLDELNIEESNEKANHVEKKDIKNIKIHGKNLLNFFSKKLKNTEKIVNTKHKSKKFKEDKNSKNQNEDNLNKINYNNLTLYFEMEYKGTITVSALTTIGKNMKVPTTFTLNYLKGPMLVRLPALLNHTRIEFSILNIDKLEYLLDSNINNKYFKKTTSKLLHNFFLRMFKRTYTYPHFYPQYLPSVIPSIKEVNFKYNKIENEEDAKNCMEDILLFMSMDFRVSKINGIIIHRKGNYFVNQTDKKLLMSEINIKKILKNLEVEKNNNLKTGQNSKKDDKESIKIDINGNISDANSSFFIEKEKFLDRALCDDFMRYFINELFIFKDTISSFLSFEVNKIYDNHCKVTIKFENKSFLYNRFVFEDCVIFKSDEDCDFFAFRLRSLQVLEIFSYLNNDTFLITENRVKKFKNKLSSTKLDTLNFYYNKRYYLKKETGNFNLKETNKKDLIENFYRYLLAQNNIYLNTINIHSKEISDISIQSSERYGSIQETEMENDQEIEKIDKEIRNELVIENKDKDLSNNDEIVSENKIEKINEENHKNANFNDEYKNGNLENKNLNCNKIKIASNINSEENSMVLFEEKDDFFIKNLKTKTIKLKMPIDYAINLFKNDPKSRLMINFDNFKVVKINENESKIYLQSKEISVDSLEKENIFVDLIEDNELIGFVILKDKENSILKLYHNNEFLSSHFHSFLFNLKLKEKSYFFEFTKNFIEEIELYKKKFEKVYKFENTSIKFELDVNLNDEIYFYLYNKNKGTYEIDQMKIVGSIEKSVHSFILGIKEKTNLMVHLQSKFGNLKNKLRIYNNQYENVKFIDTFVELKKKCKYKLNFNLDINQSLFWDIQDERINGYLVCDKDTASISGSGLILIGKKNCVLAYYNKFVEKLKFKIFSGITEIEV